MPLRALVLTLMSLLTFYSVNLYAFDASQKNEPVATQRIITLSPHLTELVYALNKGEHIIAVSDYSDYPPQAEKHPSIASYEGANIAEIMRLQPTHILAWRGGNKDADIQKLSLLGFNIFESSINSHHDLLNEITRLGQFLSAQDTAQEIVASLNKKIQYIQQRYDQQSLSSVYYLSQHPLMGLGKDPWLNQLLSICGIKNVYETSLSAYPALQLADILRKQPEIIIAANGSTISQVKDFWSSHSAVFSPKLLTANPDALHRFTPRAIDELMVLCEQAYAKDV